VSTDSPFPELKKTHTLARRGRPWRDYKPPPSGPVWAIIQGYGSYWMLVAAVDLGVFDGIESIGSCRVEALAEHLDVSPLHLQHLLDALVTFGFLDQVEDVYELTETAERYLCTSGAASMASLVHVAPGPLENWTHLAETIRSGTALNPIENDPGAFYGPLVQATFATQFRAATRLGFRLGWTRRPGLRVLDLGAGRAPWSLAVLEQSAGSTAVVNDLDAVIPLAETMIAERGVEDRVELRPGDFHQIDIEPESFDMVMLGHVCRTEGDEAAGALVRRAFDALRPGGQIVLADYFADNTRKYNPFGVQMGITMLANTRQGGLITYEQVRDWLVDAGFEFIRVIEPIGFNQVFVASRPEHRDE
jgi:ubiquinone/menaquinone biosynthesis C-methylase UbiE